jgi:hypothetical protein
LYLIYLNLVFQSVFKRQVLNDIYGQKSAKSESNIEKFLIDCSKHIDPSNFLFVENGSKSLKKNCNVVICISNPVINCNTY